MGAWVGRVNCFYISWKRSFHSPVELDLTPTWPILWSSDRVTAPQPATHLTFFRTNSSSLWTIGAIGDETTTLVLHHLIISYISEKQPDRAEHRYHFQQNIPTVQFSQFSLLHFFPFLSFPTCHNWLPAELPPVLIRGGRGRHLCFKTCFHKKLYWLRLSKASNARAGRDLLFKAGPRYELKIWLHARLTASFDGFRISLC